jgi:hypothetical protein
MAKEIKRLAISNPPANTDTLAFLQSTSGIYVVSVLVSNKDILDERISVWAFTSASVSAYIASSEILEGKNSYSTQKFALNTNDRIYVRSTGASTSFMVVGVNQTEI